MASTNFLQWNPSTTNQETDPEYLADSQRTGGAVNNTPFLAPLGNKAFYQWSTFCAAFGQMMANKGYSTSDASVSALAAVLANIVTDADLEPGVVLVSYSPTPTFNAVEANGFQMTLSGNITSSNISGVSAGQLVAFYFIQDSVGGRTVSWPASMVGTIQPDPAPNAVSVMLFRADVSGILRASGPMVSNNGVFATSGLICPTQSPGDSSTNAASTAFVQAAVAASFSSGSNANGAWVKDPTGTITQRGTILVSNSGTLATGSITFPVEFSTTTGLSLVVSTGNSGDGGGYDCMTCYYKNLTVSGALAVLRGAVDIGGSGISGLSTPVPITWIAIGT